ncbi:protein of unknown function [Rhodovastum atsumiense]|nr:protein of unknown function [Rhodovastum atsumiense]
MRHYVPPGARTSPAQKLKTMTLSFT